MNRALVLFKFPLLSHNRLQPGLFHDASYAFVVNGNAVCMIQPYGHPPVAVGAAAYTLAFSYRFY